MDGWLPILFMVMILKIPIFAGMYLVWYAIKAEPEVEESAGEGDHSFRRWRREPKRPSGPRRGGPHAGGAHALPDCPPAGRTHPLHQPAPLTASAKRAGRR
jgi:hypothetical protein